MSASGSTQAWSPSQAGGIVLTPAVGSPVAVPRAGWEATCDLLAELDVFSPHAIATLRRGAGVRVLPEHARRIAELVADELARGEHAVEDRVGLERLRDFCASSRGFAVGTAPSTASSTAAAPEPAWHAKVRRALGPFGIALIVAVKWLAKLKFLFALLPKLKFASTAISGLVTIGVYTLFWGWRFAVLFVLLLFVHEMGHVVALRLEGVPSSAPMFIPLLGAVVGMRQAPKNAWVEAKVGLAGPLLGSAGALVLYEIGRAQHSNLIVAAAYVGFFLNLINLVPVTPLDGGRAAAALHPFVWIGGIGLLAFAFFRWPNFILGLILVFGARDAYRRLRDRKRTPETAAYYRVTAAQRAIVAVVYIGLAAALVYGMAISQVPRPG